MNQQQSEINTTPRGTILIVEDSPDLLTLMSEALGLEGHTVVSVRSGAEALAYLAENRTPDLILCDLIMPDMSGTELIARLRKDERYAKTKMLVISGANHVREKAVAAGADGYIAKPFDIDKLYRSVTEQLPH